MAKMGRRKRSRLITAGLLAPDKTHPKAGPTPAGAPTQPPLTTPSRSAAQVAGPKSQVPAPESQAVAPKSQAVAPKTQTAAPKAQAPATEAAAHTTQAVASDSTTSAPERLDVTALAERVKARRREKGWTQADVARNGGPSAGTVSQIERCLSEEPAADTLAKLDAGLEWPERTSESILRGEMAGALS
ncbi:helix-turn-helix domain-containing protein [Nocardia goodfellowii]|uniref:Ribosome-binding protein aMBF1 (Putative translation factor) n=1 Tax=Nocardia goodfellowii TaxID=882446 RepID=A0ABS4QQN7_9NOCA|nr:helix-turn-helix domain-containing protein [Nocardia goodfellowii]MBP2193997.1 ribosome-binding protein aMBF1 (putative translation factor) [Nocardia goodfellowii]